MKFLIKRIILSFTLILMLGNIAIGEEVSREHRAIWMSAFLGNNWPSTAITATNAESQKSTLIDRLKKFKNQNINVLYYHVRANCDAMYESSYEPWSANVSGTRGVAPAFDPFAFIVEQAHNYGIEVYAWVNPYRYHANVNGSYGTHELNYETSHPEWLINGKSSNRVLNPAIEEVKQRVVDVCKEIITKYDIDGLIFDDYFYPQGGMDETSNAPDYAQYKASGTSMSIADWRRANVNDMVSRVHKMLKENKPYVCFGISPAGRYNSPTIESYGLPAAPFADMQYSTLYCDPLAWLDEGTVDFISPQIYWPNWYVQLAEWWRDVAYRFNRHLFISTEVDDAKTEGADELVQQTLRSREYCRENEAGMAFFQYAQYIGYSEYYNGKNLIFANIMKQAVYQSKVLTPIRYWRNAKTVAMVSNLKLSGTTLTWDKINGMRYTVYAVPSNITDAEFTCQREYLDGVTYTNSYEIPSDKASGYRWAVAVYDRYGNESSPIFVGAAQKTITAATLTYPINGNASNAFFDFKWNGNGSKYIVEIAEDASFTKSVGMYETTSNSLSSNKLYPKLESGKTYYWRVVSMASNAKDVASASTSFVAKSNLALISPADKATNVSLTPSFVWDTAEDGSTYLFELSTHNNMSPILYTATTSKNSLQIPANILSGYTDYYVRILASKNGEKVVGDICTFKTLEVTAVSKPELVSPNANGVTLHSNEKIKVKTWSTGLSKVNIEVATSSSFPARSKITNSLTGYATETAELGSGTTGGWSKALTNGTKYYVRARGEYNTSIGTKYTDWSTVMNFVYSSEAGIDDVTTDKAEIYVTIDDVLVLSGKPSQVGIYSISGQLVASVYAESTYDLSGLAHGAYIIVVSDGVEFKTIKYVK